MKIKALFLFAIIAFTLPSLFSSHAGVEDRCGHGTIVAYNTSSHTWECLSVPLIYRRTGLNINQAGTDLYSFTGLPSRYIVRRFTLDNPSTSLSISVATVDLRTSTGGGGTAIVSGQVVTGLTASTKFVDSVLAVTADAQTASTLTVRCVLAHGSAAQIDCTLEITPLP